MGVSGAYIYSLNGVAPQIDPTAWVAPGAVLIGDVRVGPGANIWFGCILRGDTNPIIVGARSNIQDGTIIHVDHGENFTEIGADVTIGHAAIIHACKEEGGMLGARALLTPGKRIGPQELWTGSPAKLARVMSDAERAQWDLTVPHYVGLSGSYRDGLHRVG
jgi:carbonic anhydrase/acetyltransferase-like protein (isoleucine patch superfamily)